jgi:hypothetical protein
LVATVNTLFALAVELLVTESTATAKGALIMANHKKTVTDL